MDDAAIRTLLTRLARPDSSGGAVVERAAIFAEGVDSAEVVAWIIARGGAAEALAPAVGGGLHERHLDTGPAGAVPTPRRFVLPPGALTDE